jgi:hypothetical protein
MGVEKEIIGSNKNEVKVFTIHIQYPVTHYQYQESEEKRNADNVNSLSAVSSCVIQFLLFVLLA